MKQNTNLERIRIWSSSNYNTFQAREIFYNADTIRLLDRFCTNDRKFDAIFCINIDNVYYTIRLEKENTMGIIRIWHNVPDSISSSNIEEWWEAYMDGITTYRSIPLKDLSNKFR